MINIEFEIPDLSPAIGQQITLYQERVLIELLGKRFELKFPSIAMGNFVIQRVKRIKSVGFNTITFYVDYKKPTEMFLFKIKIENREQNRFFVVIESEEQISAKLIIKT